MRPRPRSLLSTVVVALLLALVGLLAPPTVSAQAGPRTLTGIVADGGSYLIEVPADWNGTLLLYAHGYSLDPANPAKNAGNPQTRAALLERGYALAGGSYPGLGWQTPVAVAHQLAVLGAFRTRVGQPSRVIAWGHSMGGEITALLAEQRPDTIDGAVPMCPQVAGEVVWFNAYLDGAYTMRTLLDPAGTVPLVGVVAPLPTLGYWTTLATVAQQTPQGRARLTLAAAFATLPGWTQTDTPEPAARDFAAQQAQQAASLAGPFAMFSSVIRADMEARVGGPFSWNTGVDYGALYRSLDPQARHRVTAMYAAAGLDLRADLAALAAGPRVAPYAPAIATMNRYAQHGTPGVPVLALQATGDDIVFPSLMRTYQDRANRSGHAALVRQAWVAGPGHCAFTPAEEVAALTTLDQRLATGRWPATSAQSLQQRATAADMGPARFTTHLAAPPPRPWLTPWQRAPQARR